MQMYTRTLLTTAIHIYVSLPNFFLGEGASNGYVWMQPCLQLISLLGIDPDFQTWFNSYDLTCHDLTPIMWCTALQYINGCKNKGRREFCHGIWNSERNISSGWQGKLITKRHKCNKARILKNVFHLKRKALLHGKWWHDTEW